MITIIGYDKGDNIKAEIDGKPYKFATTEGYGGISIYGIGYPGDDFFTMISRNKKAERLYNTYANQLTDYIKSNT